MRSIKRKHDGNSNKQTNIKTKKKNNYMAGDISWTQLLKNSWQGFSKNHLPGAILWILAICLGPAAGVIMNNKKSIIIGAAIGLTVLVWVCKKHGCQAYTVDNKATCISEV